MCIVYFLMDEIKDTGLFFKYTSINKNTFKALKNNELFFSSPVYFNDPFDAVCDIFYEGTKDDWKFFWGDEFTDDDLEIFLHDHTKKMSDGRFKLIKEKQNIDPSKAYQNTGRVLSLTQKKDDILMWSHYADEHKGICLCFESIKLNDQLGFYFDSEFLPLYEVKYSDQIPSPINYFDFNMEGFIQFLTTKYLSWNYEKEYRLIGSNTDLNDYSGALKKFKKNSLVGIIFGLNTPREHIRDVYDYIKKYYIDEGIEIYFYKCQVIQGKYAVYPKKIDIELFLSSSK